MPTHAQQALSQLTQSQQASNPWLHTPTTSSTQVSSDINRHQSRFSLQDDQPFVMPDSACNTLQQPAPQTLSRIVITTSDLDPACSFSKEANVGNKVICYVPRHVVFSEPPNFMIALDVVHMKCTQTDVNFSVALLCKPLQLPENCPVVWTADDRIRQQAMWSSPKYVYSDEKAQMNVKASLFKGRRSTRQCTRGQLAVSSVRGPVSFSDPPNGGTRSVTKKYQGRVPSIVALLTNHAKSHKFTQKYTRPPESQVPESNILQSNLRTDKEFWQKKRFAPLSQEIFKAWNKENNQLQTDGAPLKEQQCKDRSDDSIGKLDSFNKGKFGFSYHLDPPTTTKVHRPNVLKLPPPPQIPLPPLPEAYDSAVPGTSSQNDRSFESRSSVAWKGFLPVSSNIESDDMCKPFEYQAQRVAESFTFVNPYTKKPDHKVPFSEETKATEVILTPHSERQRRESTCLFLPEEVTKPHPLNRQKLSAVFVLTMFVMALLVFYLVYFLYV